MSDFPVFFRRSFPFSCYFFHDVQHATSKMMFAQSEQNWKNVIQKQSFQMFLKIGVLKFSQTSQENACVGVSF